MFLLDAREAHKQNKHKEWVDKKFKGYLEREAPVVEEILESADLMFVGRGVEGKLSVEIGVELKKNSDIFASLRDGRLMEQPPRMLEEYDFAYLLLIGPNLEFDNDSGKLIEERREKGKQVREESPFRYHYLNSILVRFEAAGGLVRREETVEEAAAFVCSMYRWWQKPTHQKETFFRKRRKGAIDWSLLDNPLAEMYERLGIGIERAKKLAEIAPTAFDLVTLTDKDLRALPGFGSSTVAKVREYIGDLSVVRRVEPVE
tara:strand:- start:3807 stop:4586 length:780 start_codon:yes stop_codon:yes gene_type:complete